MKRAIGIGLLSLALGVAGAASAEQRGHERAFKPSDRVEARLAYIRTALKITDAQQAQWSAFADTMRRMAAERDKRMQEMRAKWHERKEAMKDGKHEHHRPSVIERMQRAQQMHADAVARINEVLAVEKPLYDSLSPEQKQVADEVLMPHGRRGGFGHRGFGRG
ncbi:MAG TPA: Spy/CpxP family protein refolding chaperone [Burkholderiales bacterium]|nr:Spy/CpxP family protein refolding chaperone [Burkholderiales bacterium]